MSCRAERLDQLNSRRNGHFSRRRKSSRSANFAWINNAKTENQKRQDSDSGGSLAARQPGSEVLERQTVASGRGHLSLRAEDQISERSWLRVSIAVKSPDLARGKLKGGRPAQRITPSAARVKKISQPRYRANATIKAVRLALLADGALGSSEDCRETADGVVELDTVLGFLLDELIYACYRRRKGPCVERNPATNRCWKSHSWLEPGHPARGARKRFVDTKLLTELMRAWPEMQSKPHLRWKMPRRNQTPRQNVTGDRGEIFSARRL